MVGFIERVPLVEQIVDNREQFFFCRVPGFQQVIVEFHIVDRFDGCFNIGVCGEQYLFCIGEYFVSKLKKGNTFHFRHALIGNKQSNRFVFKLQLFDEFQCFNS